ASTTSLVADSACTHGPLTRACWNDGYSIATDFDIKFPVTGNTVYYNLEITNGSCNPDGYGARTCLLVNNVYPGPVIRATWGDMLSITVKNSMQDNATAMHWHGLRQYHSPGYDGVPGITECPIAPGQSMTYNIQVTQFGTSWYHSHYSMQYGDGTLGAMVLEGPATDNYDIDLGPYVLNEWYYKTAYQMEAIVSNNLQVGRPPPNADNILINGTNKNANGGGTYNQVFIKKGKKYRLRLINSSVDNQIWVSLDNHTMTVMSADLIPIKPYDTETILIDIGQRYDVVIHANQAAGNYWFRANAATFCLSGNNFYGRAIWTYDTIAPATPTSPAYAAPTVCGESSKIAPYWYQPVPSGSFTSALDKVNINLTRVEQIPGEGNVIVWALNTSSINVDWEKPTLQYVMDGNTSYPSSLSVVPTLSEGEWNYVVIQQLPTSPPLPHPFHLHGHDFFVLGQGTGTFSASTSTLNWDTPPRRDTATVLGGGWLAIAFNSNNPGTWLMHCHIAWHISEGLGLQFLESPSNI
ncbi:hypothetical protein BAUCODRAFT_42685, partial [Baudoinia panamericana UAMH 10762]